MEEKHYNRFLERVRWWLYHPRFELIYLLGGIPNQHNGGVLHYRNIEAVVANLKNKIPPPIT